MSNSNKKMSTRCVANKALKMACASKRQTELKYFALTRDFSTTDGTASIAGSLFYPSRGSDPDERIGDLVTTQSIVIRGTIKSTNNNPNGYRLIFFTQRYNTGNAVTTNVLTSSIAEAAYDPELKGTYQILFDKYFACETGLREMNYFNLKIPYKRKVRFIANAGQASDVQQYPLKYLIVPSEQNNAVVDTDVMWEGHVFYTDM